MNINFLLNTRKSSILIVRLWVKNMPFLEGICFSIFLVSVSIVNIVSFEWNDPLNRLGHSHYTMWCLCFLQCCHSVLRPSSPLSLSVASLLSLCRLSQARLHVKGPAFLTLQAWLPQPPQDQIGPEAEQAAFFPPPSLVFLALSLSNGRKRNGWVGAGIHPVTLPGPPHQWLLRHHHQPLS